MFIAVSAISQPFNDGKILDSRWCYMFSTAEIFEGERQNFNNCSFKNWTWVFFFHFLDLLLTLIIKNISRLFLHLVCSAQSTPKQDEKTQYLYFLLVPGIGIPTAIIMYCLLKKRWVYLFKIYEIKSIFYSKWNKNVNSLYLNHLGIQLIIVPFGIRVSSYHRHINWKVNSLSFGSKDSSSCQRLLWV